MRGEQQRVSRLVAVIIAIIAIINQNPNPRGERVQTIVRHRLLARLAHAGAAKWERPGMARAQHVHHHPPRRRGARLRGHPAERPLELLERGVLGVRAREPGGVKGRRERGRARLGEDRRGRIQAEGGGEGPVVVQRERAGGRDQRQGHDALDAKPRVVRHETRQGVGGPRARTRCGEVKTRRCYFSSRGGGLCFSHPGSLSVSHTSPHSEPGRVGGSRANPEPRGFRRDDKRLALFRSPNLLLQTVQTVQTVRPYVRVHALRVARHSARPPRRARRRVALRKRRRRARLRPERHRRRARNVIDRSTKRQSRNVHVRSIGVFHRTFRV